MTTKTIRIMFYDMIQKKFLVDTVEVEETEAQTDEESAVDERHTQRDHAYL